MCAFSATQWVGGKCHDTQVNHENNENNLAPHEHNLLYGRCMDMSFCKLLMDGYFLGTISIHIEWYHAP